MCGDCNNPFHGLGDDLDDAVVQPDKVPADPVVDEVFGGTLTEADRVHGLRVAEAEAARVFNEKCPNCRGTGSFVGRGGRNLGECFKCKGTGRLTFKTSPTERNTARVKREERADAERIKLQADRDAWRRANPEDFAWMSAKQETFEFARSMYDSFIQYGRLTERQHATVTRLRLQDAERLAGFKAADAARIANAPVVNVDRIEQAFAHAQDKGVKRPKMRLGEYKFSLAPATGRNAGALYVTRPSDDQYLGKIQGGKFTRVRECSEAVEAEIVALANDPHAASIAYGQRTGVCGICGRELTNHASIDLGIGPICAEKYGWA